MISILTCTYNRPEMLDRCTASVRSQMRGDWEHLITDDGSTDSAQERLLVALAGDHRVRVRQRPHVNQPARYWNEMIDLARGDYICFLDDDNEMRPVYLETMAGALDAHPDIDVVTCGMTLDDGHEFHKNLDTASEIWKQNTIDNGCFMIRREAMQRIGYYPLCIHTLEDWALMRRAAAILRMEHLPVCLTRYHEHGKTRSKNIDEHGLARDAAWIKAQTWAPTVGVRVFGSDALAEAARLIPWVREGTDLDVEVGQVIHVRSSDGLWIVAKDEAEMERYRSAFGARRIACFFDGSDLHRRLKWVLNCVRSHRYEAVIS